jgi:hypothetical protein
MNQTPQTETERSLAEELAETKALLAHARQELAIRDAIILEKDRSEFPKKYNPFSNIQNIPLIKRDGKIRDLKIQVARLMHHNSILANTVLKQQKLLAEVYSGELPTLPDRLPERNIMVTLMQEILDQKDSEIRDLQKELQAWKRFMN